MNTLNLSTERITLNKRKKSSGINTRTNESSYERTKARTNERKLVRMNESSYERRKLVRTNEYNNEWTNEQTSSERNKLWNEKTNEQAMNERTSEMTDERT